jgi:hypothetical protein
MMHTSSDLHAYTYIRMQPYQASSKGYGLNPNMLRVNLNLHRQQDSSSAPTLPCSPSSLHYANDHGMTPDPPTPPERMQTFRVGKSMLRSVCCEP